MKKLLIITGPAGIGKTTVCRELFKSISGSAWLDGDWCWMVNPYPGKTAEQKRYVEKAFGYLLDGYFNDDNTKVILFSWLIHSDFMFDLVTNQITYSDYELIKIVLVCSDSNVYIDRMNKDGRRSEQLNNPDKMDKYHELHANIVDVAKLTPSEVAHKIREMANLHK